MSNEESIVEPQNVSNMSEQIIIPQTHSPVSGIRRQKTQFGEPIDFRGLRFAPINEQGVVYLFGMVSRELGILKSILRQAQLEKRS